MVVSAESSPASSVLTTTMNGFSVLEANTKHLTVSFVDNSGKEIYQDTLIKVAFGKVFEFKGQAVANQVPTDVFNELLFRPGCPTVFHLVDQDAAIKQVRSLQVLRFFDYRILKTLLKHDHEG